MTGWLLDTNVLSEVTRPAPDRAVQRFLRGVSDFWLSSIVVHELLFGLSRMPEGQRRAEIAAMIEGMVGLYRDRILPIGFDEAATAADLRSRMRRAGRALTLGDSLIAATALVHGLELATRNTKDFDGLGVPLVNPWEN